MKRSGLEDVPGFAETMATIRARFAVLEAETDAIFERLEPYRELISKHHYKIGARMIADTTEDEVLKAQDGRLLELRVGRFQKNRIGIVWSHRAGGLTSVAELKARGWML
jgi:hypothetical protein